MKRKMMTVRAFENSVRQTVGVIELDVVTGPYQFKISLNVVDIEASFTFGKTLVGSIQKAPSP